jgi:hypothetical protein
MQKLVRETGRVVWLDKYECYGVERHEEVSAGPARPTASSVFLLLNAVLSVGLSVSLFGFLSDHLTLRYGAMALKYSIICCPAFYILSAALFFMAALSAARLDRLRSIAAVHVRPAHGSGRAVASDDLKNA